MDRRARLAGIDFSFKKDDEGIHLSIKPNPERQEAQREVFAMFDELRTQARRAGITTPELMAHWAKSRFNREGK